ncbi:MULTISPECIES: hypothetical protein [Ralstonia]|uniref:Uncharacterized protein n=2 Tax=Ralstonia TaxID=48736 RepID=A0AAD2F2C8_9RALS|nr:MULTISPECIES: hypothetical protein [Ralstonia]NMV39926.1 hypothetical protein [Ralstonia insidiosa]CAJ0807509.1 hypothetical protein R77560_04585 [Ralstonia sp. LMG 18095]
MNKSNQVTSRINPESGHFVPAHADVVSPAVLAQVFGEGPIPFQTNADGSVPAAVYLQHLETTWELAMQEAEHDIVSSSMPLAPLAMGDLAPEML